MAVYGNEISNVHLPVSRGIVMSEDDIIRRDLIQHLTCDFAVNIHAFESQWDIDFEYYFAQEIDMLSTMESDGLVTVDKENIQILPKGRLLVRHICMVFDVSMQKGREVKAFSKLL
jgi:oxygen-independent coproporphyrinogen-3 oxidase